MSRKLLPLNPRQMVGLADGNSFYCSCEESMQPWLHGKPIIVASNNDGCAIAMNRPAKRYVRMGDALFQIADTIREHGIVTFSSNYELYGDMSNRMHSIWASFVPNLEIYSIDEAFLDFTGMEGFDFEKLGARSSAPPGAESASRSVWASPRPKYWPRPPTSSPRRTTPGGGSISSIRRRSVWRR